MARSVSNDDLGSFMRVPWSEEIRRKFLILKGLGLTKMEIDPLMVTTPTSYETIEASDLGVHKLRVVKDPYNLRVTLYWEL